MKKLLLVLLVTLGLQTQAQINYCDSVGYSTLSNGGNLIVQGYSIAPVPGTVSWSWLVCNTSLCFSDSGSTATFNQAYVSGPKKWGQPVVDRELMNDIYRHEYRHLGLGLIQSNQNRKFGLAGFDYPLDKSLRKAFSPHSLAKNTFPMNFIYGMKFEQDKANEEAYMRYLDTHYAQGAQAQKSRDWLNNMIKQGQVKPNWDYIEKVLNPSLEKQIATATYKNNFPAQPKQGLLNDPASWLTRLLFGDK